MSDQTRRRILSLAVAWPLYACTSRGTSGAETSQTLPSGGDFTLTDQDDRPFELSSLKGTTALMFFGFLSCPDICPTTLSKLAAVQRRLGAEATKVRILYVSIDPGRDTPAALKTALAGFGLDAVGLTGTKAQLDRVVSVYGAAYDISPTPDSAMKYTVSHTTTISVIDPEGRLRRQFRYETSVDRIVSGVRSVLDPGSASRHS